MKPANNVNEDDYLLASVNMLSDEDLDFAINLTDNLEKIRQRLREKKEQPSPPATPPLVLKAESCAAQFAKERAALPDRPDFCYARYSVDIFTHLAKSLIFSGQYLKALQTLCDFEYLMIGMAHGQAEAMLEFYSLMERTQRGSRYQKAKACEPAQFAEAEADFELCADFVRSGMFIFAAKDSAQEQAFFQLAIEHGEDSPLTRGAQKALEEGRIRWPYLKSNNVPKRAAGVGLLWVAQGHHGLISGALALKDGRVLTWSNDPALHLWSADGKALAVLEGHEGPVLGAVELKTGKLVSWAKDGMLRIWSQRGEAISRSSAHKKPVFKAWPLNDGRVITSSEDRVLLWDFEAKAPTELGYCRWDTRFLSDGRAVGVGQGDGKTLLYVDAECKIDAKLAGHTSVITGYEILPDDFVLVQTEDYSLWLWDAQGEALGVFEGRDQSIGHARRLPDGRLLVLFSDGVLRLWSHEGRLLAEKAFKKECMRPAGEILPDGRILTHSGVAAYLWSYEGDLLAVFDRHVLSVNGCRALPDERVLTWSEDGTLRLWSIKTATRKSPSEAIRVDGCAIVKNGNILSWGDGDGVRLWNNEGAMLKTIERCLPNESISVLPLADGRILTWARDHSLRLWNTEGGALATFVGHADRVREAHRLPDGRFISYADDQTLRLWSTAGESLAVMAGHEGPIQGVLALSSGRLLSWGLEPDLRLWGAQGEALEVMRGHHEVVTGALELPDGKLFSWSWHDPALRLWDKDGKLLAVLEGHRMEVYGVQMLPDGRILSWAHDRTLRLWGGDGSMLGVLEGHKHAVEKIAVAPDGRLLTWSWHDMWLWSKEGKPLAQLVHDGDPSSGHFLPDGRILTVAYGCLYLWSKEGKPIESLPPDQETVLKHPELFIMTRKAIALEGGRFANGLNVWDPAHSRVAQRFDVSWSKQYGLAGGNLIGSVPNGVISLALWEGNKKIPLNGRQ